MSLLSPPASRLATVELQMRLFETWTKFQVPASYQNFVMLYLGQLQSPQLEEEVHRELTSTLQLNSHHHQLQRLRRDRSTVSTQLNESLNASAPQLAKVCALLEQLRSVNLSTAELILSMRERYNPGKTDSEAQLPILWEWLQELDGENELLKRSYVAQHIRFDPGYDPFLLYHYEYTHNQKVAGDDSQVEPVRKLFGISIHHAYRLLRTRNAIMDIRAQVNPQPHYQPAPHLRPHYPQPTNNQPYLDGNYHLPLPTPQQPHHKYQDPPLLYSRALQEPEEQPSHRTLSKQPPPIKIQPITINPTPTPIRSFYSQRPESSSLTEIPQNKLKFSRIGKPLKTESDVGYEFTRAQPTRQQLYVPPTEYEESRSYNTGKSVDIPRRTATEWGIPDKPEKYRTEVNDTIKPLKLAPISVEPYRRVPTQQEVVPKSVTPAARLPSQKEPTPTVSSITERPSEYLPARENIKNYNPVKKQLYQRTVDKPEKARYDYNLDPAEEKPKSIQLGMGRVPGKLKQYIKSSKPTQEKSEEDGLSSEMPIEKYPLRTRYPKATSESKTAAKDDRQNSKNVAKKETSSEVSLPKIKKSAPKIDQQCQTLQLKSPKKEETPRKEEKKKTNQQMQTDKINSPKQPPAKQPPAKQPPKQETEQEDSEEQSSEEEVKPPPKKKGMGQESDATIEEEDIIDERPKKKQEPKESVPLIRTVGKNEGKKEPNKNEPKKESSKNIPQNKPNQEQPQPEPNQTSQISNNQKTQSNSQTQIKIKMGKSTLPELQALLSQSNINPKYLALFEMQKLQQWLKTSQTYLMQFLVNDKTAVIALCSPIPNIGVALKLWAPVLPIADDALSLKLFKRYIASIEKDSTGMKIMYSGAEFPELIASEFVVKKEKLYEKINSQPPKESTRQFEQFLELSCSNIRFSQTGDASLLYSTEIDQFSDSNHYCPAFIKTTTDKIPENLQNIFKVSQKIPGFKQLNKLLEKEGIDTYEGSNVQAKEISLLRTTLVTSFKATFIAQDGYFKFAGTLIHEKDKECVTLIPMTKANGNLIFAKGLVIDKLLDIISKKGAGTKCTFTVAMFSKKLYGKMTKIKDGCYGNWEINLNWQDEIKGRVKHSMKEAKQFGSEPFWVAIQIQKQLLYCAQITENDHTF